MKVDWEVLIAKIKDANPKKKNYSVFCSEVLDERSDGFLVTTQDQYWNDNKS